MDPSPLLPPSSTPRADTKQSSATLPGSIDAAMEKFIGENSGPALLFQALLAAAAKLFDSQLCFVSIFTDAPARWHCTGPGGGSAVCPGGSNKNPSAGGPCSLPVDSWSWDSPAHSSIVSDWSLDCISPSLKGFPASAFFLGCLAGGLALSTLADTTLGRKKMLFFSCLFMGLAGVLTAFSPNIWVYIALRFVTGFFRSTINTTAIVLSTELVGKRWRDQICVAGFVIFTMGYLSIPVMAYVSRDWSWRVLYLMISIPCMLYALLLFLLAKESPRWLLVMGRKEEAIQTLKGFAASNNNNTNNNGDPTVFDWYEEGGTTSAGLFSTLQVLAKSIWAFKSLVAVMFLGFGLGMGYLGFPFGVGNLGFNLYLGVAFNALSELPSSLLVFVFVSRMRRRSSVFWFSMVGAACSLACVVLEREVLRVAAELVAFFCACSAFAVMFIYLVELFPTSVRSTVMAMFRQSAALAGVLAPTLVAAGAGSRFMPFGPFGLIIGFCGLPVLLLRETRGEGICDTMEEQEYRDSMPPAVLDDGGGSCTCLP